MTLELRTSDDSIELTKADEEDEIVELAGGVPEVTSSELEEGGTEDGGDVELSSDVDEGGGAGELESAALLEEDGALDDGPGSEDAGGSLLDEGISLLVSDGTSIEERGGLLELGTTVLLGGVDEISEDVSEGSKSAAGWKLVTA